MGYSVKEVAEVLAKREQEMRENAIAIGGIYERVSNISIESANAMLDGIIQYLEDKKIIINSKK